MPGKFHRPAFGSEGTTDNSPAFQRRELPRHKQVPKARLSRHFLQPTLLQRFLRIAPTLKTWY
jgi:hypothetical protein